jgi:hypothetical protein
MSHGDDSCSGDGHDGCNYGHGDGHGIVMIVAEMVMAL